MIEGLKVTIKGDELQRLCDKQAAHHTERAKAYRDQLESMRAANIEPANISGGDPLKALLSKEQEHEVEAAELDFYAAHIKRDEEYLLDRQDLVKLGIAKNRW